MICPKCGKEMEKGMLETGSSNVLFQTRWWIGVEKGQSTMGRKPVALRTSLLSQQQLAFFGSRCPECQILVIEYNGEKRS
ncbi:MAG: PF20097 family protein [Methanomassiliicoccales archaeon]|nr:PF20097 family protein [Methanomassiliicoccales archaeon]